jgi:hypothetical protein
MTRWPLPGILIDDLRVVGAQLPLSPEVADFVVIRKG